jgi:hypothetical protein
MTSVWLQPYLNAFYPGWNSTQYAARDEMVGNVVITYFDKWLDEGVYLTPLFRLLAVAPGMHIAFTSDTTAEESFFRQLFQHRENWTRWIASIKDMSFRSEERLNPRGSLDEFHILFESDRELPWTNYERSETAISPSTGKLLILSFQDWALIVMRSLVLSSRYGLAYRVETMTVKAGIGSWESRLGTDSPSGISNLRNTSSLRSYQDKEQCY